MPHNWILKCACTRCLCACVCVCVYGGVHPPPRTDLWLLIHLQKWKKSRPGPPMRGRPSVCGKLAPPCYSAGLIISHDWWWSVCPRPPPPFQSASEAPMDTKNGPASFPKCKFIIITVSAAICAYFNSLICPGPICLHPLSARFNRAPPGHLKKKIHSASPPIQVWGGVQGRDARSCWVNIPFLSPLTSP